MPDINHTFMNLREQILSCRQCQSDFVLNPILLSSAIPALKLCRSARRLPGRSIIQESLSMMPAAEGSAPNGTESPMKFFIIRTTFTLYPSPTVIPVKIQRVETTAHQNAVQTNGCPKNLDLYRMKYTFSLAVQQLHTFSQSKNLLTLFFRI